MGGTDGQQTGDYRGRFTANRRFLSTDERGSIVAATDSSGNLIGINTYDEYGKPGASNIGRFQNTGQAWLPEAGVYHYKTREYLPHLGIFAQTDPLRYDGDSPNLYAYALDDPVNFVDPLGLKCGFVDPPVGTGPPPGGCPDLPDLPSLSSVIGGSAIQTSILLIL